METKDTISSCSESEEQQMQQMQKQAKKVLKTSNYYQDAREAREDFKQYTHMETQSFKDLIIQNMESIEKCIVEKELHEQEIQKRLNDRKLQIQECKVQQVKAADATLGDTNRNGFMNKLSERRSSRNDTDIIPSYDTEPMAEVPYTVEYNVFAEQPETINDTYVVETVDSNLIPISLDMCDNKEQADQNAKEYEDECVVLANLKLDHDENKKILKQFKKLNTSLTHELNECKYALEESNDIRDKCISTLHDQEIELEKYKKYKNCQLEKEEVERKMKDTLCLLAQQKFQLEEAYDLLRKEQEQLKKDFKIRQDKDIENLSILEHQVPYEKDDLANIFAPNREETLILDKTKANEFEFERALKQEMFEDLEYVQSFEKEVDELEFTKAEFSNEYDLLLQECVSKDIINAILRSFDSLDEKINCNIPIGQRFSPNKSSVVYVKTPPPISGLTWKQTGRIFTYVGLRWIPTKKSGRWRNYPITAESDSLPHAHAQTTKTYYTHQDSRIKKAKDQSKTKTFTTMIFKIFLKDIKIIKTKIVKGDCQKKQSALYDGEVLSKDDEPISVYDSGETLRLVADYKSLEKEADESLKKSKFLEKKIIISWKQSENVDLIAQIQDKTLANAELKTIFKGNGVDTKFEKQFLQPIRNQSVVRQPTEKESVFAKIQNVIAHRLSRNSSPTMSTKHLKESFGSNDMVHNYNLDEARKKAHTQQDGKIISKPSVTTSTEPQNTASGM
ncbi:hypothetical protein Tco_0000005 [Tanacetum coccineum]